MNNEKSAEISLPILLFNSLRVIKLFDLILRLAGDVHAELFEGSAIDH